MGRTNIRRFRLSVYTKTTEPNELKTSKQIRDLSGYEFVLLGNLKSVRLPASRVTEARRGQISVRSQIFPVPGKLGLKR